MEGSVSHLSLVKKNYNSSEHIEKLGGKKNLFERTSSPGAERLSTSDPTDVSTQTFVKMCMKEICIDFKLRATKA